MGGQFVSYMNPVASYPNVEQFQAKKNYKSFTTLFLLCTRRRRTFMCTIEDDYKGTFIRWNGVLHGWLNKTSPVAQNRFWSYRSLSGFDHSLLFCLTNVDICLFWICLVCYHPFECDLIRGMEQLTEESRLCTQRPTVQHIGMTTVRYALLSWCFIILVNSSNFKSFSRPAIFHRWFFLRALVCVMGGVICVGMVHKIVKTFPQELFIISWCIGRMLTFTSGLCE